MANTVTYVQLRFSRTDGRSWTTGISGYGEHLIQEARDMAANLTKSCDYIEVTIEQRQDAVTHSSTTYSWSSKQGWK